MCSDKFPLNKNHHLFFGDEYRGMPVLGGNFPMVTEYLDALDDVIGKAAKQYARVFAFRFDLRLPLDFEGGADGFFNTAVSRFVASLKAKIRHNRATAVRTRVFAHDTKVRYFWVREVGSGGRVHYHFTVLLNAQAFNWLGRFESIGGNMANRVWEAWASALGVNVERAKALVHFPQNPSYELKRDDPESIASFFQRASYLCKARSKQYGYGHHGYGASRI